MQIFRTKHMAGTKKFNRDAQAAIANGFSLVESTVDNLVYVILPNGDYTSTGHSVEELYESDKVRDIIKSFFGHENDKESAKDCAACHNLTLIDDILNTILKPYSNVTNLITEREIGTALQLAQLKLILAEADVKLGILQ